MIISVVVPNLNEEKSLPYFLDSLRRQKYRDYELVVVDGGSSDRSRSIIDGYRFFFPVTGLINNTRHIAFVRNFGATCARGELLLFTNSDAVFPEWLLMEIAFYFKMDPNLQALSGRTVPYNGGFLCFAGYYCFDLIRAFMARRLGKFSPSGNFLVIKTDLFWTLGGFPNAKINEDGTLGHMISEHCSVYGGKAVFDFGMWAGHFAKRWKNPLKTLFFYSYVFGNFNQVLKRILAPLEKNSGEVFSRK